MFALVDCNNFYASCERAFNPRLEGKPIIVLSNNDGCVIARSNEAKALGVKMGEPYFKCKAFCEENRIHVFSSNYELYDDMSGRVMTLLQENCANVEIYSIDEAFLALNAFHNVKLLDYATELRKKIKSATGIPVSVGIGATKTLAKIANHVAKKHTTTGVFHLTNTADSRQLLDQFPVSDIWGVGRKISARLKYFNIHTAQQLKDADPKQMRQEFSVVMEKMIAELNGESCLPLEEVQPPKQQIMSSRSFGHPVVSLAHLEEAVSTYTARACNKLRREQSLANGIYVFLETNRFRQDQKQYSPATSSRFIQPTADTRTIITQAKAALKKLYRPGYHYKKAGVMLLDLIPNTLQQFDLLTPKTNTESLTLMKTIDTINQQFGQHTLFFCAEGTENSWRMQRNKISQRYTTAWDELPTAMCNT